MSPWGPGRAPVPAQRGSLGAPVGAGEQDKQEGAHAENKETRNIKRNETLKNNLFKDNPRELY